MIDALDRQLAPLERDIRTLARRQAGCRELMRHYGIGPVTATSIVAELGDVSRLSASRKAVRCAGLDVGVHRSDHYSRLGKLTRQGSPHLRWALYEAAQSACKPRSPDHGDYLALKARGLSHTRATMTIARKLARRCFHSLRQLGPAGLEPMKRSTGCRSRVPAQRSARNTIRARFAARSRPATVRVRGVPRSSNRSCWRSASCSTTSRRSPASASSRRSRRSAIAAATRSCTIVCASFGPATCRRPRSFQRTVYRPGELAQFDLCEPRAEIPVGSNQSRKGYLVTCKLPYSRAFAGALVFSKEWQDVT